MSSEADPGGSAGVTELDPTEFVGDGEVADATQGVADHAAAEGAESPGRFGTWKRILLATEPDEPLESVESPWNPEQGGVTRVYRGFRKMVGFDGMPAIADVVIGAIEAARSFELEGSSDDVESSDDVDDNDNAGDGGLEAAGDVDPITAQVRANEGEP